ncbi:Ring domain containing protein [Pandoravirus quercus]|uniref:Ring domain containing protein n=1 Tax=Pandoravirus quercus TaxID=2107709 RepID=A0A2U7U9Q6_9VIRU|nr:Ring domain containing protein [Pandoravirus quercus]AVK75173.1 Ring domain containing protein [Pandoravirus quercus]
MTTPTTKQRASVCRHTTGGQKPWDTQRRGKIHTTIDWQQATTNRLARAQERGDAIVAAMIVVDTRADRHLGDCAADVSLKAWLLRTRGASLPAWAVGIDIVDLVRLPRPDPGDNSYGNARLMLLWAQWGDADAAHRLCDMAQDMCSTDTCHGRLAPLSLRKDIALWHPIVACANNIQVRLFVPVLAEIAAAGAANDGPTCVVCMCDPPTMVLEPCGHLCLCTDDWQHLVGGPRRSLKCPLCRAPVEAAWRIRSLSAAEEEPAGNKPAAHLSGSTDTGPGPEQADMDIDDVIGLDLDLDPEAFAAAIRTVRVLTMFQRLIEHMEPSATSNSGSASPFVGAHSGAHRRRGNGGARDGDHGDDDMRGDGHRYSSMGRPAQRRDRVGDSDDDSDSSSSSSDDDDEVPRLVANSDSDSDSDSDDDGDAPRGRQQASVGIESTGLPFTRDDIDLVASHARVSHDIAFDALLATEGNIIDAIHALC